MSDGTRGVCVAPACGRVHPARVGVAGLLLLLLLTVLHARPADAEECSEGICVGGTTACTIDGSHVLSNGCFLDFGTKDVTILGVLTTADEESSFSLNAGKVTVRGKLEALGGGTVEVNVASDFRIVSIDNSLARINVNGNGSVEITAGNDVILDTQSNITADGSDNFYGGEVLVIAGGDITSAYNASISADGGQTGDGGKVRLYADGDITLEGTISATTQGAGSFGGVVEIRPGRHGNLTVTHSIDATTNNSGAFDGHIELGPACTVVVSGTVKTRNTTLADGQGETVVRYSSSATFQQSATVLADEPERNRILCRCQDTNHDHICDGGCVSAPVGLQQADFRPDAVVTPVALPPCGCGDGVVQPSLGEQCDDGNSDNLDGCRYDCRLPTCGDGIKDAAEDCDLGPLNGASSVCCTATCVFKPVGSSCSDGSVCTQTDQCSATGTCVGSNPVTCPPPDQCHTQGSCHPVSGCSNPVKPNGTACDDSNACTTTDHCTNGICAGMCNVGATCGSSCGGTLTCQSTGGGGCQCQ